VLEQKTRPSLRENGSSKGTGASARLSPPRSPPSRVMIAGAEGPVSWLEAASLAFPGGYPSGS